MSGGSQHPAPAPEGPTEELPISEVHAQPAAAPAKPSRILERAQRRQAEFHLLANAVRQHRRASRSPSIAVTAADRRLYAQLERLEQAN